MSLPRRGAPYSRPEDLARAKDEYLRSLPATAIHPTGSALEIKTVDFMVRENKAAGYTADGRVKANAPKQHPKLDRNIVLERFAASVATGWFANYPADSTCEMLTANKSAIAKHIIDMGEALTDEFMRRIEQ